MLSTSNNTQHRDPTFEAACRLEINEKGCAVCMRRRVVFNDEYACDTGLVFPFCRVNKKGFILDEGRGD